MGDTDSAPAPEGLVIDAVDWLPSGGRSGLVRVRGRWTGAQEAELPELVIELRGEEHRHRSLPEPGSGRVAGAWRGAYVVHVDLVAEDAARVELAFPGGARVALPRPDAAPIAPVSAEPAPPEPPGGDLVDPAVLSDRRARRAEAAEQAQARITREALKAVEVLELRAAELEERLQAASAERDALAARPDPEPEPAPAVIPDTAELDALRARLAEAEAEARRSREPAASSPDVAPTAPGDADRRAERLREALTTAIGTVGELRLQLHEARVSSRTGEIARAAESVRLTVLASERAAVTAELSQLRRRIADAEARAQGSDDEIERAEARAQDAETANEETRREVAERVAELDEARARIAALEADIAGIRAEAESASAAARAELGRVAAALNAAETASEVAEATAAGAVASARAADVARASMAEQLAELRQQTAQPVPAPSPARPGLHARAAAQESAAAVDEPVVRERLVADLAAAAEALRAQAPDLPAPFIAPEPDSQPELEPEPELEPKPEPEPGSGAQPELTPVARRAVEVSAPEPPGRVATGRAARRYPPLRGALVKLAHDDPRTAAELLVGLLPAQWRLLPRPVDYDLTIAELGTFAVTVHAGGAKVCPIDHPRTGAEFHLRADALTLAEMLAGHGPRPRRFGRARVTGRARRARVFEAIAQTGLSLAEVVRAGAILQPEAVLRTLAYAVPPAWTRGHDFSIAHTFSGADGEPTLYITARDGRGLTVSGDPPPEAPRATIHITRTAFSALLRGEEPPPGQRPVTRGDHRAAQQLRAWVDRARTTP